jgi:ParB-like chromosome segregation protein Spo0J
MGESTEELLNRKLDESVKSGLYGDIRKNGITTPVSVSTRIDNPQILDGHHRVAVMLNLSPDEVSIPVTAPPRNRSVFSERLHTDEL